MGAYDSYKDKNGVTWTIATSGTAMLGTVLEGASPKYVPQAEDMFVKILTPGDSTQAEVERKAFIDLREKIDQYSKDHASSVALVVSAKPGLPWWVWVAGALLAFGGGKGRRRR